jgi:hypothetical protein
MERCFLSTPIGALRGNRSSTSVLRANADRWQGLENHFGEERQQRDGKQNPGPKAHASMGTDPKSKDSYSDRLCLQRLTFHLATKKLPIRPTPSQAPTLSKRAGLGQGLQSLGEAGDGHNPTYWNWLYRDFHRKLACTLPLTGCQIGSCPR